MIIAPLEFKSMKPLAAVAIAPLVVNAPVLYTITPPFAAVLLIPLAGITKVAAVLVNEMFPLTLLVALKYPTEFAPFSVVPLTVCVVSADAVILPGPVSVIVLPV
jgi:hypothetical protein